MPDHNCQHINIFETTDFHSNPVSRCRDCGAEFSSNPNNISEQLKTMFDTIFENSINTPNNLYKKE